MSDGAIGGVQMGEHGGHRDIGKSEGIVIKSSKVKAINSGE